MAQARELVATGEVGCGFVLSFKGSKRSSMQVGSHIRSPNPSLPQPTQTLPQDSGVWRQPVTN